MKANELLFWLSAKRHGSWRQFRAAVQELHCLDQNASEELTRIDDSFPLHQQLRLNFERLGHAEFFCGGCEEGWRVAPPTLATHSHANGVRAILCGARSTALCETLIRVAKVLQCETLDCPGAPDVIRVCGDVDMINAVANQVGVYSQSDAPLAVLSQLPLCEPPRDGQRTTEFPVGSDWDISAFDSSGLVWRETDRSHAQTVRHGVFRFLLRYRQPLYFLRWKGEIFRMPRGVAVYALLRHHRRSVLSYAASTHSLRLPAICRPPRLLERALVLCSGLPPCFDPASAHLTYSDVPEEIAALAGELLRQPLL